MDKGLSREHMYNEHMRQSGDDSRRWYGERASRSDVY